MNVIAYLAVSLDGYIADAEGGVDWLNNLPNPDNSDYGFADFLDSIDAILMGANTFRTVQGFGVWPYTKPVFVLSNSIKTIPEGYKGKIELITGDLESVFQKLEEHGFKNIYADGGTVIKNCMVQGLLDELIITHIPLTLGAGIPLFPSSQTTTHYNHIKTEVLGTGLVKSHYQVAKANTAS